MVEDKCYATVYRKFRSMRSIIISMELFEHLEGLIAQKLKLEQYQVEYICQSKRISDRCYESLDALKNCNNSLERAIETLVMKVSAGDDISFCLIFGKIKYDELTVALEGLDFATPYTVYGHIKGKEEYVSKIYDDINYQINRCARSRLYSFISHAGVLFTLMMTLILFRLYYLHFGLPQTYSVPILGIADKPFDTTTFLGNFSQHAQLYKFAFYAAVCMRFPIKCLFPRTQIILGDNVDQEQRKRNFKEKFVWNIIVVFMINIVVMFVQWYLFS